MRFIFSLLLLPLFVNAQTGVSFTHDLRWNEVVAKAQKSKKYIFVDAFATWCGPCKYMAAKVFTLPEVGELVNSNYISVKMQMDTTAKDSEGIKRLYADAHKMSTDYKVRVYPTYLIFSPEGKLVHRFIGSMEASAFNQKMTEALKPEHQYYTLLDKYKAGEKKPELIRSLAYAADDAADDENLQKFTAAYLASTDDAGSAAMGEFAYRFARHTTEKAFEILQKNESSINQSMGHSAGSNRIVEIISADEIPAIIKGSGGKPIDWDMVKSKLSAKYPKHADEVALKAQVTYYRSTKNWDMYPSAAVQYMDAYGSHLSAFAVNEIAWTVFEHCMDAKCLQKAIQWSKHSLEEKEEPAYMDTYANLLYKTGKREEAIEIETRAMAMAPDGDKGGYSETLEKMKKGENTW